MGGCSWGHEIVYGCVHARMQNVCVWRMHASVDHVWMQERSSDSTRQAVRGILPNWVDEDKHGGPSKTSVLGVFGALDTHVHLQVIAIALEIDAVEGLEDRRGDHGIDQEQEAQHREEEG